MHKLLYIIFINFILTLSLYSDGKKAVDIAKAPTFRILMVVSEGVSTGTGFVINDQGYLITNNHVINGYQNGSKIVAINDKYKYEKVKVIKAYPRKDLAILKIDDYKSENGFLQLQEPESIKQGYEAYSLGYPGGADFGTLSEQATMKKGIVSKLLESPENSPFSSGYRLIETDADVNKGNSGGPLLSNKGTAIGVNTVKKSDIASLQRSGEIQQGIFWAIHIAEVITVLKSDNIEYSLSQEDMSSSTVNHIPLWLYAILAILAFGLYRLYNKKTISGLSKSEVSQLIREKLLRQNSGNNDPPPPNVNNNNGFYVVEEESYLPDDEEGPYLPDDEGEHTQYRQTLTPHNSNYPTISIYNNDQLSLGKSHCTILVNHQFVSRKHLIIYAIDNKIYIEDVGSTNGTFIDTNKLNPGQKTRLDRGQTLYIGSGEVAYTL